MGRYTYSLSNSPTHLHFLGSTLFYSTVLQVTGVAASDGSGITKWHIYPSFKKTGQLATVGSSYSIAGGANMQTAADYGYYYSDPTAANGVSTSCSSSNQYTTLQIYPTAPALNVVNLLRGLTTVINQDSDSISVTRTAYGVNSGRVGYLWTITFVKQVTDRQTYLSPPLACTYHHPSLTPTTPHTHTPHPFHACIIPLPSTATCLVSAAPPPMAWAPPPSPPR